MIPRTLEMISRTLEMISRTLEMISRTLEMISRTLEMISRTLEMISRTLETISRTLEMIPRTLEMIPRILDPAQRTPATRLLSIARRLRRKTAASACRTDEIRYVNAPRKSALRQLLWEFYVAKLHAWITFTPEGGAACARDWRGAEQPWRIVTCGGSASAGGHATGPERGNRRLP
jgi:hypothetical protein